MSQWTLDQHDLSDKIAIVTGANSGIGLETARALAERGAHVVLACRNPSKAAAAQADIEAGALQGGVECMPLDLSSLDSVAAFADAFRARFERLDLLINNAGVMAPPKTLSADGFELQFATNHLGHFALTGRLLDRLLATPGARIVNVSSLAHRFGRMDLDDLAAEQGYSKWGAYGRSKLANLLFTFELQRRLAAMNAPVQVMAAHPGWTATNLQDGIFGAGFFNAIFAQTPARGALPTLRAALDPEAAPASYYGPKGVFEVRGDAAPAKIAKRAQDGSAAAALWQRSVELTGVPFAPLSAQAAA